MIPSSGRCQSAHRPRRPTVSPPHPGGTTADADHGEHVAFLQYSSGSTGKPKGVVNTHQSILRQAAFAANVWNGDDDMHMVSWLPLYHDMGIFWGVFMPLLNGGCTTLIPPHDFVRNPRIWLETVSRFRGNWIGGPDFAYRRCIEAFDGTALQSLDLSCLRLATNGAEPVRGTTLRDFTAKFRAAGLRDDVMAPQYGLAEAGLGVTGSQTVRVWVEKSFDADALERGIAVEVAQPNPADGRSRALVSCGDGAFGWDIQIVDPDRHMTLTDGEVGEIWVGGPGLPDGYWRQPEQTATTFGARTADGLGPYLRTGDAGFRYQGELYVCGRYRDLIIVGGRNHFPNDIEKTVEEAHCGVAPGGRLRRAARRPPRQTASGGWCWKPALPSKTSTT
ncbi:Long-chain-fatty-acid--AMP ligase FadD29 [Mycobacterium avium subsp. paratuberculosis]|nr:Long-chain-fatty-acid--AMP ligase FadD29 [Mycobacterium avium subsp. paratuberculosis]OVF05251.1 Long-chain-fatty-acid--AMP ligase FadD29 [Mycobacterium avium subsp. paratuberculosis]